MMNDFSLRDAMVKMDLIASAHCACTTLMTTKGSSFAIHASLRSAIVEKVTDLSVLCVAMGFDDASQKLALSLSRITEPGLTPNVAIMIPEMRHIIEAVELNANKHRFLNILSDRAEYLDNNKLLGDDVHSAFPSAAPDLKEAGNCLAVECNTAAVFHLMRVVEWGLRALAASLGVRKIRATKKPGNKKYTPLPYAEWEKILDGLQDAVDAKMQKLKRGTAKQKFQEFYYPALQDIRGLRDAWRNHVMHTRAEYTREDAIAVLAHVKRLMQGLAIRVSEV